MSFILFNFILVRSHDICFYILHYHHRLSIWISHKLTLTSIYAYFTSISSLYYDCYLGYSINITIHPLTEDEIRPLPILRKVPKGVPP